MGPLNNRIWPLLNGTWFFAYHLTCAISALSYCHELRIPIYIASDYVSDIQEYENLHFVI